MQLLRTQVLCVVIEKAELLMRRALFTDDKNEVVVNVHELRLPIEKGAPNM